MEWKYLRKGKGQNVQSFNEKFRKQALNVGISLDSPDTVTKYVGVLHSYIKHSLLFFEPTMINASNIKEIHLERRGKNDRYDKAKKTPFNPQHGKF